MPNLCSEAKSECMNLPALHPDFKYQLKITLPQNLSLKFICPILQIPAFISLFFLIFAQITNLE